MSFRNARALLAVGALIGAAVLLAQISAAAPARADAAPGGPAAGTPWVVSVGDSYISGEGGRWAGNSNKAESYVDAGGPTTYFDNDGKTAEQVPYCHRSNQADVYLGGGINGLDLACSGAQAATVAANSSGYFKPGLDFYSGPQGQGQALALQNFAANHNVKMVAVSIGGNDFKFADLITECVSDWATSLFTNTYCSTGTNMKNAVSAGNVAAVTAKIAAAFQNIRTAMRNAGYADNQWTLVVQNYPSPIPSSTGMRYSSSGYTRMTTGGCGFFDNDLNYANSTLLPTINGAVVTAATQSGLSNVRLLDISSAFNGRRLCETGVNLVESIGGGVTSWSSAGAVDKSEWITQIRTVSTSGTNYYTQESLHPNYWGQLALRNCMRQAYNNGSPQSGVCTHGTGLTNSGEPAMTLTMSTGDVSGTVTAAGAPLAGACVYLYTSAQAPSASYGSCTSSDGSYSIPAVKTGSYVAAIADPQGRYQTSWTAQPVTATSGSSQLTLAMTSPAVGNLTGSIQDAAGPVPGACAYLYRHGDAAAAAYATCADSAGAFGFYGIAPGSYDLALVDPAGGHPTQWYTPTGPAATQALAGKLTVAAGSNPALAAVVGLQTTASVSGTITDAAGPVSGACVYLFPADDSSAAATAGTCTGNDGTYWLGGVDAHTSYKIAVSDPSGAHTTSWWAGNSRAASSASDAQPLPAPGDGAISADLALPIRSRSAVAGTVTDAQSNGVGGVCAYLYKTGSSDAASYATCTQNDGSYQMPAAAGDWQLAFFDPAGDYLTQWRDGTPGGTATQDQASTLTIRDALLAGQDAVMAPATE